MVVLFIAHQCHLAEKIKPVSTLQASMETCTSLTFPPRTKTTTISRISSRYLFTVGTRRRQLRLTMTSSRCGHTVVTPVTPTHCCPVQVMGHYMPGITAQRTICHRQRNPDATSRRFLTDLSFYCLWNSNNKSCGSRGLKNVRAVAFCNILLRELGLCILLCTFMDINFSQIFSNCIWSHGSFYLEGEVGQAEVKHRLQTPLKHQVTRQHRNSGVIVHKTSRFCYS